MWPFKKRKQQKSEDPAMSDKVAGRIAGAGIKVQEKFAVLMSKLFSKHIRMFFFVFCLSAGGYSLYLVVNALSSSPKTNSSLNVDPIQIPKHAGKAGDEMITVDNYVDEPTYRQIQGFKFFMDSLKRNKRGVYDSILIARPGLMDSALALEEIYNTQQIK